MRRPARLLLGSIASASLLTGSAAWADTLREALVRTYQSNPTLTGARSRLRAIDEGVAIARSEGRFQVSATAALTQDFRGVGRLNNDGRSLTGGLDGSLPFFQGGRVRNGVRAAVARVEAGRADLRASEGDVFTEAVAAYMDVIRDDSIVELNRNQVRVLETNLQATRDRFEVGDLTRTDVAQSEARLAGARSQLAAAEGQRTVSRENYTRVVGSAAAATLEPPPPLPKLPATPDVATNIALNNNPDIISINQTAQAAGFDVRVARSARLPVVSAVSGVNYTNYLGTLESAVGAPQGVSLDNTATTSRVGFGATIPLYTGGGTAARIRQSQALQSQALEQTIEVERFVIADTRAAFANYQAALQTITANESAVSANTLALEGVRAENSVGTRTILDVLNAEQELLNSQVLLVGARRNVYVAGFALLNAMGQAELRDLGLDGGALYDPVGNYDRVARKAGEWTNDPAPTVQATRTAPALIGPPAPAERGVTDRPN
jgi:outer membrane protein